MSACGGGMWRFCCFCGRGRDGVRQCCVDGDGLYVRQMVTAFVGVGRVDGDGFVVVVVVVW